MRNIIERYAELSPLLKGPLWKIWHRYIHSKDKTLGIKFLNYGYVELDYSKQLLDLQSEDEAERTCIQMYNQVIRGIDLNGKTVLEVGCGRGGGAEYLTKYKHPKSYLAADISPKVIMFCNEFYKLPGLSFCVANAEMLPFPDNTFDFVVNVESSRCYNNMNAFLNHVVRVLCTGGYFCFTDMRYNSDLPLLRNQFVNAGLEILEERDILPNVVAALEIDNERRKKLIVNKLPDFLESTGNEFAGIVGSKRYELFADGTMAYRTFLLRKC